MSKVHILISGEVQGVGFRFWVRQKMQELGIEGEAGNLPAQAGNLDGTVEVQATGSEEQIKELVRLCREGPALARVEKVTILKEE